MKIKFYVKDAGRKAIAGAISKLLEREAIYGGITTQSYAAGGYIVKCSGRRKDVKGVAMVNIRFSVTRAGRKAFAQAVGEILGCEVVYNGTPSFAYTVGSYIVDREGALICPADIDPGEADRLIAGLSERGYREEKRYVHGAPEPDSGNRLVIDMPLDNFTGNAIENLRGIVASKNRLIRKALGADSLRIDVTAEKLSFPWFTLTGADGEMDAYLRFITALCQMAKAQKRVTAKERDTENDKLSMRLFLIRLGFVGLEYKPARKILLRNLTGNSSWKNGPPAQTGEIEP